MKARLIVLMAVLALTLSLTGAAYADAPVDGPVQPNTISTFTLTPSTAYPGDTVTAHFDFTVANADLGSPNVFCIYYTNSVFDNAPSGNKTSNLGDVYSADWDGVTDCPDSGALREWKLSTAAPDAGAEFGDFIEFTFTVPAGAASDTFRLRQHNTDPTVLPPVSGVNLALTIGAFGSTIYVANDAAGCGGNTPCLTGPGALNQAIDSVAGPGTVFVLGAYLMSPNTPADLTTAKTVTVAGAGGSTINMAAGTCSGAALAVNNAGAALTVQNLTLDGTCAAGNHSTAIQASAGALNVSNVTVRDFGGTGIGVQASAGTVVVEGSTFLNNNTALDGTGGALYAFANNVNTNTSANAATNVGADDNVKCNYWASYNIAGAGAAQYEQRLGSGVSTYIEGAGALTLGRAALPNTGSNHVLVNLGRDTANPPFHNGTVAGLGALVSDFFVACTSRGGTDAGAISVQADNVSPASGGLRLFRIQNTADCSPSTNTACWSYDGVSSIVAGATLTALAANEGHYVIGNGTDPTAVTLRDLSANGLPSSSGPVVLGVLIVAVMFALSAILRKRMTRA